MTTNLSYLFLTISLLIGLSIAIQMIALHRNNGKLSDKPILHWLSFFDMAWFIISGLALYFLDLNALQKSVPSAFILYTILSFFYAGSSIEGTPTRPEDIIFGKSYLNFGLSFALVFSLWVTLILIHSVQPISWLSLL